jgi:hypothetical protein
MITLGLPERQDVPARGRELGSLYQALLTA